MRKAEPTQQAALRILIDADVEARLGDALEINTPPTDNPVFFGIEPLEHNLFDYSCLSGGQIRLAARRFALDQPVDDGTVEGVNPVAQGLAVHAVDPRRNRPVHGVPDRRQPATALGMTGSIEPIGFRRRCHNG
jgi:hypothetical protein